jgi:hypothetical protein
MIISVHAFAAADTSLRFMLISCMCNRRMVKTPCRDAMLACANHGIIGWPSGSPKVTTIFPVLHRTVKQEHGSTTSQVCRASATQVHAEAPTEAQRQGHLKEKWQQSVLILASTLPRWLATRHWTLHRRHALCGIAALPPPRCHAALLVVDDATVALKAKLTPLSMPRVTLIRLAVADGT